MCERLSKTQEPTCSRLFCLISILLLVASLPACSGGFPGFQNSSRSTRPYPAGDEKLRSFPQLLTADDVARIERKQPWQTWAYSRDLEGQPLRNVTILEGDELVNAKRPVEALERYRAARSERLSRLERDSLVIRISSLELELDRPQAALQVLSDYFRATDRSEDTVDGRFSLIFGYAFGRQGEIDQSLAWFSRTNRLTAGTGGMSESASQGVRLLLRTLPSNELAPLAKTWGSDSFVHQLVGRETHRRSLPDFREPAVASTGRFWEARPGDLYEWHASGDKHTGSRVGILLPLSGKFGELGNSTKRGIELAMLGQEVTDELYPDFRDTLGDTLRANAEFRELASEERLPVVLGPLLSDVAQSIGQIAKPYGVSVVSFSKRSFFPTGDGVFRLGPTVETQVDSLVEKVYRLKNFLRFGIIAPDTEAGNHYAEVFRRKLAQLNLDLVYQTRYAVNDEAALAAIAGEVEPLPLDAIFFPDSLAKASRFYGNLPREKRSRIRLLGLARWDNAREIAQSRTVMEGAIFVSPFFGASSRPVVKKFNQAFERKYGRKPDFLAAQGFDAATIVVAALKRHDRSRLPFVNALHEIEQYEGLTGDISVRPDGELMRRFTVVELNRGRLQELTSRDNSYNREWRKPSKVDSVSLSRQRINPSGPSEAERSSQLIALQ